jgi:hypothetical protein
MTPEVVLLFRVVLLLLGIGCSFCVPRFLGLLYYIQSWLASIILGLRKALMTSA